MGRPKKTIAEEATPVVETVEETVVKKERKKQSPEVKDLKKQIAALHDENEVLKLKIMQSEQYVKSATEQKTAAEEKLNALVKKYTILTDYVKKSIEVFHRSMLTAFDEEVR